MRLSSTQRRFFAIYILFILCMLLLLVPLFNITMGELERNAVNTSQEVLSGGLTRLEDEMRLIFLAGTTLFQNQQVASMAYTKIPLSVQDAYRARQALQVMDDIRNLLEMTEDFGIVFKEGIILANGRMHLSASDFFPKYVRDGVSEDLEAWLARLKREGDDLSFTPMRVTAYPRAARDVLAVAMTLPLRHGLEPVDPVRADRSEPRAFAVGLARDACARRADLDGFERANAACL